jgi:predicted acetyltransferase
MDTIKSQIKDLWKLCFDDSDEFIELYFRMRYNQNVNIFINSGNRVISALQMLPYPFTYCGNLFHSSYISGACTHPDYRNRGVMRRLLSEAFADMSSNSVDLSTLIPANDWLYDYYATMGYGKVFYYSVYEPDIPDTFNDHIHIERTTDFYPAAYEYFNAKMHGRSCCVQHTEKDVKVILADMKIDNGFALIASRSAKVIGMALVYIQNRSTYIAEMFADNEEAKEQLIYAAAHVKGRNTVKMIAPVSDRADAKPLGMARIINAEKFLRIYANCHPDVEMNISLTDEQLSSNNAYYYVYKGKCMVSKERLPGRHISMSMSQLAELIFADANPYMSLMMN